MDRKIILERPPVKCVGRSFEIQTKSHFMWTLVILLYPICWLKKIYIIHPHWRSRGGRLYLMLQHVTRTNAAYTSIPTAKITQCFAACSYYSKLLPMFSFKIPIEFLCFIYLATLDCAGVDCAWKWIAVKICYVQYTIQG